MPCRHKLGRQTARNRFLAVFSRRPGNPIPAGLLRHQPLQPVEEVERLARAELVGTGLAQQRLGAAADSAELVQDSADGITTNCGVLSIYQRELAAHCRVPVAASALMQIPLVDRLLPPRKRAGVLTFSAALLGPDHLVAAGAAPDTPIVGAERGREFWRVIAREEMTLNIAAARQDILAAGDELVAEHPEVGAVVLERANLVPFARALRQRLQIPVYDI